MAFMAKGVGQGKRPELIGGGLVRSAGGWAAVSAMRRSDLHMKNDDAFMLPKRLLNWLPMKGIP